jgi:hypothetical protein
LQNTAPKSVFDAAKIALSTLPVSDLFGLNPFGICNFHPSNGIETDRTQSSVKDCIACSNENAVMGAPTGKPCSYLMMNTFFFCG